MITNLLTYQRTYLDNSDEELNEVLGPNPSAKSRKVYERFVVVERESSFAAPVDRVFQSNFKTLWFCAQQINKGSADAQEGSQEHVSLFVKQAVLDQSYLLIHDLVTLINQDNFAPGLDWEWGLRLARNGLDCKEFVRINSEKIDCIKEAVQQIGEIDTYICHLLGQRALKLGGVPYANPSRSITEMEELLTLALVEPITKRPLIDSLLHLGLLSEQIIQRAASSAFDALIQVKATDKILQLKLVGHLPAESFNLSFLFNEAMMAQNFEMARYLVLINENRSPTDRTSLGILYGKIANYDHVEALQLLELLAEPLGGIPKVYKDEALQAAKAHNFEKVLEFLTAPRGANECIMS